MPDGFGQPASELTCGKRAPGSQIYVHLTRLVEEADQICGHRRIHTGFAADRCVRCGQQGCCIIQAWHSAAKGPGQKSGQISHRPAAYGDDTGVPPVSAV
ncbi:hypothetical protein D3C74_431180 [compost metagenome]